MPQTETLSDARDSASMSTALSNRYVFECKLGQGSQGQVWLATRKSDGERVAIKQLNVHSVTTWKQYELFKREAKILESLTIEGVAPFYEYIEELEAKPPFVCIVQKYIEGKTLAEMLKAKHRFETEAIYDIVAQTLRILQKIHSYQPPIVHRDIKPSNLMLTPMDNGRYQVTLLDFGAVANPQVQNGGSTVAGTFGYMPPEQLMGQAQPASDIYALAAVTVELLSGTSPADIPVCDFKLVIEPYLSHVPTHVIKTLNAMLEPAMDNRICDHTALIAQFDALAHKKQPSVLDFLHRTTVPKLRDVESICQPGNYEIWQNLDQTEEIDFKNCPCHLNIPTIEDTKLQVPFRLKGNFFSFILLVFAVLLIIFSGGVFFLGIIIFCIYERNEKASLYEDIRNLINMSLTLNPPKVLLTQNLSDTTFQSLSNLLHNGQKTVGIITAIIYKNTHDDYSVIHHHKANGLPCAISFDIPKFLVIYRFQYLYQGKNYELYGQLITHVAPENRYKVGDPITLIADITSSNKSLYLSVFPYPYPFGDMLHEKEVICSCATQDSLNMDDLLNCPLQLASAKLSQWDAGDGNIMVSAASIYRVYFRDEHFAQIIYFKAIEKYLNQFEAGDCNAGIKAAEIYEKTFSRDKEAAYTYQNVAKRLILEWIDGNKIDVNDIISIYRKKLKNDFYANKIEKLSPHIMAFHQGDNEAGIKAAMSFENDLHDSNTADQVYIKIIERCIAQLNAGNIKAGSIAAKIYQNRFHDSDTAKQIYYKIAEQYVAQFETGDLNAGLKAAEIYQNRCLDDKTGNQIVQRMVQKLEKDDGDAAIHAAIDIYRDVLVDETKYINCHKHLARRYLPKPQDSKEIFKEKINIYRSKLKYERERICWQMLIMIWMDEYHVSIEDIWHKLEDFEIPRELTFSKSTFEAAMFTVFSYFDENWFDQHLHNIDIHKLSILIKGLGENGYHVLMSSVKMIWNNKLSYQNHPNVGYNIAENYYKNIHAYSEAKIWYRKADMHLSKISTQDLIDRMDKRMKDS